MLFAGRSDGPLALTCLARVPLLACPAVARGVWACNPPYVAVVGRGPNHHNKDSRPLADPHLKASETRPQWARRWIAHDIGKGIQAVLETCHRKQTVRANNAELRSRRKYAAFDQRKLVDKSGSTCPPGPPLPSWYSQSAGPCKITCWVLSLWFARSSSGAPVRTIALRSPDSYWASL